MNTYKTMNQVPTKPKLVRATNCVKLDGNLNYSYNNGLISEFNKYTKYFDSNTDLSDIKNSNCHIPVQKNNK